MNNLRDVMTIVNTVGNDVVNFQGGGGNISVKISDNIMAVKASGYRVKDLSIDNGYVLVDYQKIKEKAYSRKLNMDYQDSIIQNDNNMEDIKIPSVETSFHSILDKYVIHTHSIFTNMVTCMNDSDVILNRLFNDEIEYISFPFINPGDELTYKIIENCIDLKKIPNVMFLANHGLIVHSHCLEECFSLIERINKKIAEYYKLDICKDIKLCELENNKYLSKTPFINNNLSIIENNLDFFINRVLFPDQLVYINCNINKKIKIEKNHIIYFTNYIDAMNIEETLLSYLFIENQLIKNKKIINYISKEGVDFISNMKIEDYRSKLYS